MGTWEKDCRTGRQQVNDLWWQMLGYAAAPEDPGDWKRFLHPEDLLRLQAQHQDLMQGVIEQFELTMRLRHCDGRWIWVLSRGQVAQRGEDGRPEILSGLHVDITASKEREIALQQANARLRDALEERDLAERRFSDIASVSSDWFWETDVENRFTYLSESFTAKTGRAVSRLLGLEMRNIPLLHPGSAETADWPWLEEQIRTGQVFRDFVYFLPARLEGDQEIWVRTSGLPFYDADGIFLGYRGVSSDITGLYTAKERAEAASRAKSQFLANMSHEIRTPLNGVLGMAELLAEVITDPQQKRMISTIRDSGEGLLTVLNDILDLAKVEAGKLAVEVAPFRPAELAERLETIYSLRAQERGLRFTVLRDPGCSALRMGDPHRLLQVLYNLVSNALKFTHEGGAEVVFTTLADGGLRIRISDTGIGMTPAQQARAFEDFEQADGATTRRYGGTGLGLAISRRLIALMGGSLQMQSQEGVGTQMLLELPPAPAPEESQPPEGAPTAPELPAGLRVLVADDNATNRLILSSMLQALGVTPVLVSDGREAVAAAAREAFDILLLDISMPEMDGITALGEIRDQGRVKGPANDHPQPLAAAVTANVMTHQIAGYLAAGFDGCLGKPFRRVELQALLREFCRRAAKT